MSPHCVWIITVGGVSDDSNAVEYSNTVILTELGKYKVISEWFTYN